ncbi:MAG: 23S rRNA (guanosine(2251)-2'-O)-methyltransferase RlmB, partial [Nitrospinota bacterium]|nr:23S rRNA (guanosine(2251)-2'-O)-methyltransferase RlmB [Nitrospinota bacterium]
RLLRKEGFSCVALEGTSEEGMGSPPTGAVVVVLGGEGTGLRPLVTKRCGRSIRIPMTGRVGSLNVSAAAAVAFHWVVSRRG